MVAPRKGPAGIAAPAPPPAVTVVTPTSTEPTPIPEVGFDIVFDEIQFKEFVELEPSGEAKSLDFDLIVPSDFAKAVVAAARNNAGNETPTATQWLAAALEKARRVKPAVEAGKLTADQGVCVLAVICYVAYAASRKRGDSIDAALKVAVGIVDELSKPVTPPLPKVDPGAKTVEAPKTPAPILVAKAAASPKKVEPAKVNATAKPAPATTSGTANGRRGTTPTDVMTKVGAAHAAGGFGDSVRPPSDTALADAAKAAAAEAKAEAERQRIAEITARAEAERQAKQAERERLLKETADRALFDKAEADRKKAEAKAEAEAAKVERELRVKRAAKLRGDRLRLIAAHSAARATVDGTERAQLDAEHKAALLEIDAELANLGTKPTGSKRFTVVVFTVIGLLIALGLVLGALKLAESLPTSAGQTAPTATVPPVATAAPTPGVETCVPVTAALLESYLGGNDPTHYMDRGLNHAKNNARLQCQGRQRDLGGNAYDVSSCQLCYTP